MKIRLKQNVIVGKECLTRGSVVDSGILPESLQTPEIMDADVSLQQGKVLLLWNLQYSSLAGDGVSYPMCLSKGETIRLEDLPDCYRRDLEEGVHYKTAWTEADRNRALAEAQKDHECNAPHCFVGLASKYFVGKECILSGCFVGCGQMKL